jgi:hypothetical protein
VTKEVPLNNIRGRQRNVFEKFTQLFIIDMDHVESRNRHQGHWLYIVFTAPIVTAMITGLSVSDNVHVTRGTAVDVDSRRRCEQKQK